MPTRLSAEAGLSVPFVAEAVARGYSLGETIAGLREVGLTRVRESTIERLYETAGVEWRRPSRVVGGIPGRRPAMVGATTPAVINIATDYVHRVRLEDASGHERYVSIATNNPELLEEDIIGEALNVANKREYPRRGETPTTWTAGAIEATIAR